jgi:peroxiredoxin Q/BCP
MADEGRPAPDFELATDEGTKVRLSDFRGRPVVLYFYPKDDTPGCTAEACGIRDAFDRFEDAGAVVLGVSADDEESHRRFREKYGLPFTLVADPERTLAEPYGVGREGKASYERSTFVIDPEGNVARIMRRVDPRTHADEVLAAL